MPLTKSQLATLKRKAADDTLEVEHLLKIAKIGDASVIPLLQELSTKHAWSYSGIETDGARQIRVAPFAKWVEVICEYLDGGCDALVAYAQRSDEGCWHFAVAVLESLKTGTSLLGIAELAELIRGDLQNRPKDADDIVDAINFTVSFKGAPPYSESVRAQLREWTHAYLHASSNEVSLARGVLCLRQLGDESSLELIKQLPPLPEPWHDCASMASRAIKKRLKASG